MAKKRRSYESRTRANTQGAKILAEAFCRKVEFVETKDGLRIRQWRKDELQTYTQADIARAIGRRRALEFNELLEDIPPTAIKYAMTKKWLLESGGFYFVTDKAATELKLPRRMADGLAIKFARAA